MKTPTDRYSADWDGAICSQLGGAAADEIFFPTGPDRHQHTARAIATCFECPLRAQCIQVALEEERGIGLKNRFGIRGGLTPEQRLDLDPGKVCADCGTPIITQSKHCADDQAEHARKYQRDYQKERRAA